MSDLHGFRRGDEAIHITNLRGYKRPVLIIGNKNVMRKIASFGSEEYAEVFVKMLEKWFGMEGDI